jgi:hypothetical protein
MKKIDFLSNYKLFEILDQLLEEFALLLTQEENIFNEQFDDRIAK